MPQKPLFRSAALEAGKVATLGDIILIRPVTFGILVMFASFLASTVLLTFYLGTYTKRSVASGQLVPDSGLVRVYATQSGVVIRKNVIEGKTVRKGDVLYVLSSDRQSGGQGNIQASLSRQLELRRQSLRDVYEKTKFVQQEDRAALVKKIEGITAELSKLDSQIEVQQSRLKLAEENAARYQGLLAQNFISQVQAQQKQEELLDQRGRFQGMERDRMMLARELTQEQNNLTTFVFRQQNQLAQIERDITTVGQDLIESEGKRELIVTTPEAGVATAATAEVGQNVDGSRSLVSVVPTGAMLVAHLYVPSRAVGFIKQGDQVLLRYQAYPYQKFGHAKGVVGSVSKTAVASNELTLIGNFPFANSGNNEPMYDVRVQLDSQSVVAYGKQHALQAGMLLDADILLEKRRLYEWVLEPLYSITGKL